MTVLCLAADRTVAYLVKHVLAFEGFAVEVCRSAGALAEAVAEGARVVVTAGPLDGPLPPAVALVEAPDPFDPGRLVVAVRRAGTRGAAGRLRPTEALAAPGAEREAGAP